MTINTALQLSIIGLALFGIGVWLRRLRRWPLTLAVIVALLSNVAFLIARETKLFTTEDLNLFSLVRVLLLVAVIAVMPFSCGVSNDRR
jgi:hypothetical protein